MAAFNRHIFPGTTLGLLQVFLLLGATAGCGSDQKKMHPVKGKFVWPSGASAKELSGGMVVFQCDEEQISSKASIDDEGAFLLSTYRLNDGTVAGRHKVAIVQPRDIDDPKALPREVVLRQFENTETSGLEVTVEPKSNDVVVKVLPGAWMKRRQP